MTDERIAALLGPLLATRDQIATVLAGTAAALTEWIAAQADAGAWVQEFGPAFRAASGERIQK